MHSSFSDLSAAMMLILPFVIVGFLVAIVIAVFYLLTLQNCLKAISPQNRKMEPGQVWLLLIPLFNLVWIFMVIKAIADSIEAEYRMRGLPVDPKPTYNIGLAAAILSLCTWIPLLGSFVAIAYLVCWIIYWVKVNDYKKNLQQMPAYNAHSSEIF